MDVVNTTKISSIPVLVLMLSGLVSLIPVQQVAAIPADFSLSCAEGVSAAMSGITITKDGNPIGFIAGPITCPPTSAGTVDLSELGANDLRVAQVVMTKDGTPFGPSSCSIDPPADVSLVSFDANPFTGGVDCTVGDGTDALFTLTAAAPQKPVGGEVMGIDATALFVVGAFTNAYWILPAIGAAIAGFGMFRIKKASKVFRI